MRDTTAPPTSDRAALAQQVVATLEATYPDAECALHFTTPLDLLVATILSAQCTDVRVNQVTAELFQRYRTAEDYASAPEEVLEAEIRPTGFYRQKARALRGMAQMLVEEFGAEPPRTIEELTRLPGVARKTANVVLGTAFGIPSGITVDTHVQRLSYRMGLTDETDPVKIERDLMALVPQDRWIWFGHAMIWHGRLVCAARNPICVACPLHDFCPRRGVPSKLPKKRVP